MGKIKANLSVIIASIAVLAVPLSAIVPIRGADLWYVQYITLLTILFFGISLSFWRSNKYFALFGIYAGWSAIWYTRLNPRNMIVYLTILLSMWAVKQLSTLSKQQVRWLYRAVLVFAVIQTVYVVVQFLGADPIFDSLKDSTMDDTVGFSGNHNQLGLSLAVVTPLVLYNIPALIVLVGFGVFCSTTTIAAVGVMFAIVYHVYWHHRRRFIMTLLSVAVFSVVYLAKIDVFSEQKLLERVLLWRHTIAAVENEVIYPRNGNVIRKVRGSRWFGYGNGAFIQLMPYTQTDTFMQWMGPPRSRFTHVYEHAHNDYLEFFFDYGRVGLILLILFLSDIFYRFWAAEKTGTVKVSFGCLMAFMICALNIYTVQTAVSGSLLIIFLGTFLGATDGKKRTAGENPEMV